MADGDEQTTDSTESVDTQPTQQTAGQGDTPTVEQLQAELEKWKGHARKHEARVKELTPAAKRAAELEEASKTELQRISERAEAAEKRAADLEQRYRETTTRAAITTAATAAGAIDPDAVYALLDRSALTLTEDGTPTDAAKHIAKLLADKPYLAGRTANRDAAQRGDSPAGGDMNTAIRRAAGKTY